MFGGPTARVLKLLSELTRQIPLFAFEEINIIELEADMGWVCYLQSGSVDLAKPCLDNSTANPHFVKTFDSAEMVILTITSIAINNFIFEC